VTTTSSPRPDAGALATDESTFNRLIHDLKQPLTAIRATAQDVRIDVRKGRLDTASLGERMAAIERCVDELTTRLEALRSLAAQRRDGQ
jgi:signal transduction histidine kinase